MGIISTALCAAVGEIASFLDFIHSGWLEKSRVSVILLFSINWAYKIYIWDVSKTRFHEQSLLSNLAYWNCVPRLFSRMLSCFYFSYKQIYCVLSEMWKLQKARVGKQQITAEVISYRFCLSTSLLLLLLLKTWTLTCRYAK